MQDVINKIKAAGAGNSRITEANHSYSIEVKVGNGWKVIASNLTYGIAEQMLKEGNNKLLLG